MNSSINSNRNGLQLKKTDVHQMRRRVEKKKVKRMSLEKEKQIRFRRRWFYERWNLFDKKWKKCVTNSANIYKACSISSIGGQSMNEIPWKSTTKRRKKKLCIRPINERMHNAHEKKHGIWINDTAINLLEKEERRKKKQTNEWDANASTSKISSERKIKYLKYFDAVKNVVAMH